METPKARRGALRGEWRRLAYDRETGALLEDTGWRRNTIQTAGVALFCDLVIGASTDYFDQANAAIRIYNTADELVKSFDAASVAVDHSTDRVAIWEWQDNTAGEYEANRIEFYNEQGAGVKFSDRVVAFGSKTAAQNWHYQYRLTISGDPEFEDGVSGYYPGLDTWMKRMSGEQTTGWNLPKLEVRTAEDVDLGDLNGTAARADNVITFEFQANAGTLTGDWNTLRVHAILDDFEGTLWEKDEVFGAKEVGEQWIWRLHITVAEV